MTTKELIITQTLESNASIFRNARAMPEDKLTWSPLENGRTVLDLLQEVAQSPNWGVGLLTAKKWVDMPPEVWQQLEAERKSWTTIDQCEQVCKENTEKLVEAIRSFPEDELEQTVTLPFGDGMVMSFAQVMFVQYWNTVYHNGQINYIQTLYGDKQMH